MTLFTRRLVYVSVSAHLTFASILLLASSSAAAAEQETRRRVEFAWEKSRVYLKACLASDECGLTEDETQIALGIVANENNYSSASLKFVDESEAQFSSTDGDPHRLMLTGLSPKSLIYINTARIGDVPVETLVGLFAHELVHHLGVVDDVSRRPDLFGTRIASIVRRYIAPMNFNLRDTISLVFNYPQPIKIEFLTLFPKGLFPTIYLSQKRNLVVQELHMMPKEVRNICEGQGENLWSSQAKVTSIAKSEETVKASFQFVSRCFDSKPPGRLQEAISYGETSIEFNSGENDAIGLAVISFSKIPLDPVASASIDVRLTKVPPLLRAGQDLVVSATVETPKPQNVAGCGALLGADSWRESEVDAPLTVTTLDCKITSQTGKTNFAIEFKYRIPENAPDQLELKVQAVGLQLASGGFIRGLPTRSAKIKIENPTKGSRAISAAKVTASGATPLNPAKYPNSFYIKRGASFSFDILFSSATTSGLVDGYVKYQAQMIDKQIMAGTKALTKTNVQCSNVGRSHGADDIRCAAPIDLLKLTPGKEAVMWAPNKIVSLTDDLQFLSQDISSDELAVVSTEKAP